MSADDVSQTLSIETTDAKPIESAQAIEDGSVKISTEEMKISLATATLHTAAF